MNLTAQVTIDRYQVFNLDPRDLKNYITTQLADILINELIKNMTITSHTNFNDNSTTYVGSISTSPYIHNIGANGPIGTSTIAASSLNSNSSYSQINMRVVEYTKNGKVTRVELQKYDESDNNWVKIPRIKIEE